MATGPHAAHSGVAPTPSKISFKERLLELAGGLETLGKNTNIGRDILARGVPASKEWRRINDLPRRRWEAAPDLEELTWLLTRWLRPPNPIRENPLTLWPVQAAVLRELHDVKGAFCPIRVGGGKTAISLLAASVLPVRCPILVVRSRLVDKTIRSWQVLKRHFRIHTALQVLAYEDLSQAKNKDLLWRLKPDMLIFDECHRLRQGTARTKRVNAYFQDFPQTVCLAMSGTITKRSLRDFQHILRWCVKDLLCPLPLHWPTLQDWADAVDSLKPSEEERRVAPGVLTQWCEEGESVRQGVQRRLTESFGVVASLREEDVDATLVISDWGVPLPKECAEAIHKLENDWETPNGDICSEPVEVWRHTREYACGYGYYWDPPAPRDWLDARRAWKSFVRDIVKRGKWQGERADSELLVTSICARLSPQPQEYIRWIGIRHSFTPNKVAQWLSYNVVLAAVDWLKKEQGICWADSIELQRKVAATAMVPLFGAGVDGIEQARGPIVASMHAQSEGNNLQAYNRNLILTVPSAGDAMEQLLARTHRPGQEADDVRFDLHLPCQRLRDSFGQALTDARYLEAIQGPQKLSIADITFPA